MEFSSFDVPDDDGGVILGDDQSLSIRHCQFIENSALDGNGGVIAMIDEGSIKIEDSQFYQNAADKENGLGGSIYLESGSLSIKRSSIIGVFTYEIANYGGAIAIENGGNLLIENSEITQNVAMRGGGAIYFGGTIGENGAIVRNCTIAENFVAEQSPFDSTWLSGGAVLLHSFVGEFVFQNTTIAFNETDYITNNNLAGGIMIASSTGSVLLQSTIVSQNDLNHPIPPSLIEVFDIFAQSAGQVVAEYSLVGSTNQAFGMSSNNNLALGTDPDLDVLAANGGPTRTIKLNSGSPAIDAGSNPASLSTDQRSIGYLRNDGNGPDIGAFEVQTVLPPTATIQVSDGSIQRSMVTTLIVTFSEIVDFPNGLGPAIALSRTGPSGTTGDVGLNYLIEANVVTLTFRSDSTVSTDPAGSLQDGFYTLALDAQSITGGGGELDGDGNGIGGDDQLSDFHRLFGDADGNASVTASDFSAFQMAYGTSSFTFDYDGSGLVGSTD